MDKNIYIGEEEIDILLHSCAKLLYCIDKSFVLSQDIFWLYPTSNSKNKIPIYLYSHKELNNKKQS